MSKLITFVQSCETLKCYNFLIGCNTIFLLIHCRGPQCWGNGWIYLRNRNHEEYFSPSQCGSLDWILYSSAANADGHGICGLWRFGMFLYTHSIVVKRSEFTKDRILPLVHSWTTYVGYVNSMKKHLPEGCKTRRNNWLVKLWIAVRAARWI